jgi:dienelactone hydrolase
MAGANKLTDEQCFADLDLALEWSGKQPKADLARLGITGFCRGGRTTWMYTANNPRIKAGVAWYGGLNANPPAQPKTPIDIAGQLHAPVLGHRRTFRHWFHWKASPSSLAFWERIDNFYEEALRTLAAKKCRRRCARKGPECRTRVAGGF